jgi:protein arginine N-methyltransferase 7
MMNDLPRNEFYRTALNNALSGRSDSSVLEIGTGSGLLAMLAAKQGARVVYAIEASSHVAQLAHMNMKKNGLDHKIHVINKLSTKVRVGEGEDLPEKADILVCEILGTCMLGESALRYVSDVRNRLLKPDAQIIPASGRQFVTLVESEDLLSITSVGQWGGINLEGFNLLQDTASFVFTKQ